MPTTEKSRPGYALLQTLDLELSALWQARPVYGQTGHGKGNQQRGDDRDFKHRRGQRAGPWYFRQ